MLISADDVLVMLIDINLHLKPCQGLIKWVQVGIVCFVVKMSSKKTSKNFL